MSKITIYQFTDPTCIWCWGNEPTLRALDYLYRDKISIEYIMGGLVEDIRTLFRGDGLEPLSIERANARIAKNWHAASLRHGMPVSKECMALYTAQYSSSFPQNIAYEAAKRIDKEKAKELLRRIREATFTECRRTSQIDVLVELASEVGLNPAQFLDQYTHGGAQADFMQDRMKCRRNGITGFPSYMVHADNTNIILGGYQNLSTFHTVISRLSKGKLKPRKIGASIAKVLGFIKHYKTTYPVEIETAFSLNKAETDAIIEHLLKQKRLKIQTVGDSLKISVSSQAINKKTNIKISSSHTTTEADPAINTYASIHSS